VLTVIDLQDRRTLGSHDIAAKAKSKKGSLPFTGRKPRAITSFQPEAPTP
jgi:hypothetical protein